MVSACLEDYGTWTCRLFSVKLKAGATQGAIYFCASKMGGSYGVRYPSTRLAIEKRNVEPMYLSAPSWSTDFEPPSEMRSSWTVRCSPMVSPSVQLYAAT